MNKKIIQLIIVMTIQFSLLTFYLVSITTFIYKVATRNNP